MSYLSEPDPGKPGEWTWTSLLFGLGYLALVVAAFIGGLVALIRWIF